MARSLSTIIKQDHKKTLTPFPCETDERREDGAALRLAVMSGSLSHLLWPQLGHHLLSTFEHVCVLSLPRARLRRAHMARLLHGSLALPPHVVHFFDAIDCDAYGSWSPSLFGGTAAAEGSWWLTQQSCDIRGADSAPPRCLHPTFEPCRVARGAEAAGKCKYVCYTLSVAAALHAFLKSNRSRMLLVEDDICLTPALASATTLLRRFEHSSTWDIIKLGHCDPCDGVHDQRSLFGGHAACVGGRADNKASVPPRGAGDAADLSSSMKNVVHTSIGKTFCAHALGLTRRGAEQLLRLAFPVSAVFDDILAALGGNATLHRAWRVCVPAAPIRTRTCSMPLLIPCPKVKMSEPPMPVSPTHIIGTAWSRVWRHAPSPVDTRVHVNRSLQSQPFFFAKCERQWPHMQVRPSFVQAPLGCPHRLTW